MQIDEAPFKVGDTVKSFTRTGPIMTIESFKRDNLSNEITKYAVCIWTVNGKRKENTIHTNELIHDHSSDLK